MTRTQAVQTKLIENLTVINHLLDCNFSYYYCPHHHIIGRVQVHNSKPNGIREQNFFVIDCSSCQKSHAKVIQSVFSSALYLEIDGQTIRLDALE